MRVLKNHSGIRLDILRIFVDAGDRVLCAGADGIGFVVAGVRLHIIPKIRKSYRFFNSPFRRASFFSAPVSYRQISDADVSLAPSAKKVIVHMPANADSKSDKIYTYEWAVSRMDELAQSGMSDPVGYFNNEMADWWLAPGGMMEDEADFEGIARAIEERW